MRAYPNERFASAVTLTPDAVAAFSRASGDDNPIHFDPGFAASTRFGRLVASGTQTSALLMGLTGTYFSKRVAVLGLEFTIRFELPVYADETIRVEWEVVKVTPKQKLNGDIVDLRGRILGQDGRTTVTAKGRVLLTDRL
jgi:acyl dehydratase